MAAEVSLQVLLVRPTHPAQSTLREVASHEVLQPALTHGQVLTAHLAVVLGVLRDEAAITVLASVGLLLLLANVLPRYSDPVLES